MKGIATSIVITIISVVLVIFILVISLLMSKETIIGLSCKNNLKEKLDKIKYRSCEMNYEDLEHIEYLDTSCVKKITFNIIEEKSKLLFEIKGKDTNYIYDTACPHGFYGNVFFNFSLAGDPKTLEIEKNSYFFLITPHNAKLIFCQGIPEECKNFDKKNCASQKGCFWRRTETSEFCDGTPVSCYELTENECRNQKGCEIITWA